MAKQLNVNLAFNADTSKAKAQIQELYQSLNNVSTTTAKLPITTQIQEAQNAAIHLRTAMDQAFDVNTGKLDLSKFNQSIKFSGTSLQEVKTKLLQIGPAGQQAFLSLAQSIASAEIPAKRTSALLTNLGVTLKNTIKWQLSSSMLHGFMGTIQSAYGYAQNLNSSLNDIRIVTGLSAAEMDKFAEKANKAAKSLSSTTLDYTNASLIYFQQGLNEKEVEERTNVTLKMANASGATAEKVSQQMTAVWNNFDDGSKSLEYYADVMTALGAATASSTDEISQGLQKFSAVASTVGLSYEYATSALATITATTRESADVVGTALKTLFARIQGLQQGDTLEDGTTLNKYSAALDKVGISIKDANGQMKDMDIILDEMGAKWKTLEKDQQLALAQTVAGVRQYTQLVALMDNWDFFEQNLGIANNAEGTLQEQADIYAESWEAARKRVKAAAEKIYEDLLDDKFFINVTNGIEKVLTLFGSFIDAVGGAKGLLTGLSSILLHTFSQSVAKNLENMVYNIKGFVGLNQKEAIQTKQAIGNNLNVPLDSTSNASMAMPTSNHTNAVNASMQSQLQLTLAIGEAKEKMSAQDQQIAQGILAQNQAYGQQLQLLAQQADTAKEQRSYHRGELTDTLFLNDPKFAGSEDLSAISAELDKLDKAIDFSASIEKEVAEVETAFKTGAKSAEEYREALKKIEDKSTMHFGENSATSKKIRDTRSLKTKQLKQKNLAQSVKSTAKRDLDEKAKSVGTTQESTKATQEYVKAAEASVKADQKVAQGKQTLATHTAKASKDIKNLTTGTKSVAQTMVQTAQSITSLTFAISQVSSVWNIWQNSDLSFGDKMLQTFMSLGMAIPMVVNGLTGLNTVLGVTTAVQGTATTVSAMYLALHKDEIATLTAEQMAKATGLSIDQAALALDQARAAQKLKDLAATGANIAAMKAEDLAEKTGMSTDSAAIIISKVKAGATLEEAMAEAQLTGIKGKGLFATLASMYAKGLETGATWAQVVANIALSTSMSPILVITLLIVAAMAALAAVIAGVVIAIKAISNAYNADAIAAQKAAEAAKELAERYKTVKQEYEDMISAMENYQTAREGLDNLTKGTEEYQKALKEANRLALELITTYGLIAGQDYEWQGDELVIHDDAMKRVKNEKSQELDTAYAANQMAQVNAREKQSQKEQTDLRRGIKDDHGIGNGDRIAIGVVDAIVGALGIALAGVTYGASLAATAWAVDHTARLEKSANKYDEAIDKAVEEARTNEKLFTDKETMAKALNIDLNDTELIEALWSNREAIQNLSNEINANAEAEKLAAQNAANEIMMDSGYQNSESGRMALEAGGEVYQQLYNDAEKKYLETSMANFWGVGTPEGKAMWDRYAKSTGLTDLNGYKVTNYKKDGSVEYEYIDENNQKQTGIATAEMIAQTLAAADAAGQLEGALSELRNTIANLNASKDLGDHALADFLSTGNLEGSTQAEFNDLRNDAGFNKDDDGNIIYDDAAVNQMLGLTGDPTKDLELAKSRGYESAQAYKDAFIKSMDVDWQIPQGFENFSEELTLGATKNIEKTMEQMGDEGGQAYIDTINHIASGADWDNLTNDEQIEMMNRLASIDWTSWDAGEQAIAIAKEYGVSIDTASEAWQNNIQVMRDASNALPDMKALAADMRKLGDISDDIDLGKIISQEDYELLVKYNRELGNYFTILSDGSAQFIGDKLDFKQASEETQRAQLEESIKAQQDRLAEIRAQYKAGADAVGGAGNLDQYRDTENYVGNDGKNYYQGNNVQTQIDFLRSQGYDEEQLSAWETDLSDGNTTVETLNQIAEAVNTTADAYNNLGQQAINAEGMIQTTMNELALTADSAAERQQMLEEGSINEAAYGQAAMAAINEEKWEDMDADEIEEYAEHLQEIAAESELLVDDLTEEAAEDVALYTKKMNKGISKLAEGFEEWNSVLENSDESSEEYAEAMGQMKDAMSDVLGTSEEFISNDFITENLEDIEKAAKGDAEAIDRLRQALSRDILCNIMAVDNFDELDDKVQALHNQIATLDTDIKVGATLETGDFTTAAQGIVDAAGMTVEQAQAYFNSLGYEPEFVMQNEKRTAPMYGTRVYTDNVVMGSAPYGMGEYPYIAEMTTHEEQVYMGEKEQNFVVPALSADGTPQIRSLTKTSSGAMNNGSSSNKGGKGKGGGGGGGSGKAPQKKNDSEKERYHTIKNQLEDLKSEYEEIGKAKSRAFGSDKLSAMDAEIQKTDELIKKQEEYIDAISKDLPVDKAVMEAYYKDVIGNGTPIEFDENGNISNYDAIQDAMFKKYNSMADSNTDDSETWKVFEEKYKQLEEYIEQYEETYDLLREEEAAYQELINQRMDLELEKIQYAVELKINIAEDSLALLEHQLDNIEDDAFKAADAIRLLGEKTELLYDEMEANKKGLMDILQQQGMNFADMESILAGDMTSLDGKIFTENQIDAIKEYRDSLLDLNAQMEEVRKSVEEKVMETFDAWHEKLQTGVDTLDHYESVLSSYKNMVDIVGKDALGISDGFMDSLGAATMSNAIDQVKATKAAQEAIENAKMTAQAAYDAAVEKGDEASKKMWEETLNNLNEEAQSAQEDMLSAWEDALSTLADLFSEKVERIVDNFNKSVYAFGGLDGLGDDFSRQQENADMILDDYEKMYELSKLNRDISKTIDETDNIAGKQKLKKLQEQINDLQEEGVEMSEYDLEYLQKTYDLRLAELELEEARNAKNTVRLSKDNEGNWSYVYTQNTDAVDAAQQKYEDALYAMQDLSKNYIDEMSEKLVSTYQEMIDQMANLKIEDFATTEEYYAELERIQKVYQEQYNKQSAEMQKAIDNNQALYEEDIEKYSSFVKDEMNLIVAYKDTILGQLTDSESEAVDFNSMLEPAVEAMLGGLKGAAETYFANLNATMEAAGTSTDSFSEDIQENITAIKTASEEATESVSTVAEGMKLAFDGMSAIVTAWQDEYHDSVGQILEDNMALIESFNAMIAKLSEGTGVSQQNLKIMDSFNEMMQKLAGDKDGTVEITYKTTGENPEDAVGYDTGGYTGSWGKSGKMAMLHEKELVLNADDTSNFLAALKITRTLLDTIDLNAKQASLGLGQLTASTIKDEKSQILEQQVTITAEFPNVNDHNEIEEALNSLVNRASQYANRK